MPPPDPPGERAGTTPERLAATVADARFSHEGAGAPGAKRAVERRSLNGEG